MLALMVVVLWFGVVTAYLVRQWWASELAQTREGVPAPAPVTLTAADSFTPTPWGREIATIARAATVCGTDVCHESSATGRWAPVAA